MIALLQTLSMVLTLVWWVFLIMIIMSWLISTETLNRYLAVLIDARGVVTDLYWDIPTEIPWVPTDQCRGR